MVHGDRLRGGGGRAKCKAERGTGGIRDWGLGIRGGAFFPHVRVCP
jgi:hypothetical protein